MFIIQTLFFAFLCKNLIKEIFLLNLISSRWKRILESFSWVYFLLGFFYFKTWTFSIVFLLLPPGFLLILFLFLKKQEEKQLFTQLISLLLPLESQMKQGHSVINAWQKSLKEIKSPHIRNKIQKITDILKFQQTFFYPDKEIENFVRDLMIIHQSSNPLQRLQHLKRKIKVEQSFRIKSQRALLQIRLQSSLLTFFYLGLLVWTFTAYGTKYLQFMAFSFLFFSLGLFWIFKTGRTMKWSV